MTAVVTAALMLAGCGGKGSSSSTTPAVSASSAPVSVSPNPIVLSATSSNPLYTVQVTVSQASALNSSFIITSTCGSYGAASITGPTNPVTTYNTAGTLLDVFTLTGVSVGTCSLSITPPIGAVLTVPITVGT